MDIEVSGLEIHLLPSQRNDLGRAQPVAKHRQDDRRIAYGMPARCARGLHRGGIGVVFIGMPGIEKRLSRYPQLYSRVGFVHAFRPLSAVEVRGLLQHQWVPAGVVLPEDGWADEETRAAVIRITGATSDCSTD